MSSKRDRAKKIRKSLNDEYLQMALKRAVDAYRKARSEAMDGFDFEKAREEVRSVKERSIADIRSLFEQFKREAERVGAVVHEAADGEAAAEIVAGLASERGVRLIAKSKSMLTEEIELNRRLESRGLEVVETDLGEYIVQIAGDKPSHFTMPAMHKTREQVAELFSNTSGEDVESDIPKLVEFARRKLRQVFFDADMGISGANIAIAETGGIVIVANEGNDRLVTTLPPIHVAIVGYEKLVGTMEDATAILKVLSKSGTGQKQTAYVSFITGPSRTTDIEKTLTLGVHGPKELHIIFVDHGRMKMAADEIIKEALYCIKCGACLNLCPVYKSVGGHAFGNSYMGGIGAVVTAYHQDLDAAADTLDLCTGCGYCTSICPSKIDTPGMILELRKRLVEHHGLPVAARLSMEVIKRPELFHKAVRMARALQFPVLDGDGSLRDLPVLSRLTSSRKVQGLAPRFLKDILPERSEGTGELTISLYGGCMLDFLYPEIGRSIWNVLQNKHVTALFPHSQSCCGAPALYLGDRDTARKLAVDNLIALETGSPDYIVTGCPTCAVMLKEQFPMLLSGTGWEERAVRLADRVMDFSQLAADVLGITLTAEGKLGRVTYHDPCHQVRGLGSSECARKLITDSGVELVEMADSDECCGFAGSYALKQADVSSAVMERKLENIAATGAETVATDCPGCIMQIRGGLLKRKQPVTVCHTAQILAGMLG